MAANKWKSIGSHAWDPAVWKASGEIAEAVSACVPASMMYARIADAVAGLVRFDIGTIQSAAPGEPWSTAAEKGDTTVVRMNLWRFMAEATCEETRRLGSGFALDTEVFEPRRRDRMSIYREFMLPGHLAAGMIRYLAMDGRVWFIGLARGTASFSERTRARLDALFPHLRAALRAVAWRAVDEKADALAAGIGPAWSLTPAQQRVMTYVIRGLTNGETAGLLGLSINTVRNTLAEVFRKVGVSRRSELAYLARSGSMGAPVRLSRRALEHQRQLVSIIGSPDGPSTGSPGPWPRPDPSTGRA
jgi:DNA-binding CsgD family transcriptional regulator